MFIIDQLAYSSNLRKVHPFEKFWFAILTLLVCLLSKSLLVPLIVIGLISLILIHKGEVSPVIYIKLIFLPLTFLLLGVIPLIIGLAKVVPEGLFRLEVGGIWIYISWANLYRGLLILSRSLSSVSCLYFIILTTPMVEILYILKRLKVPNLFREMMVLTYRFIFTLMEMANYIYIAQKGRGGYATLKNTFYSLAQLVSMVFLKAYSRGDMAYKGLLSRGYQGQIDFSQLEYDSSPGNWFKIVIFEALLVVILIYSGGV